MDEPTRIAKNHPVRRVFCNLADRALTQSSVADKDLLLYLSELLVDFIYIKRLYRLKDKRGRRIEYLSDMFLQAEGVPSKERKGYYKYIGDYSLFILGMFPENLRYGRRILSHDDYANAGRRSYLAASELEFNTQGTLVFRKLAAKFEHCVLSLNWVRQYTHNPFYQYMFRQFGIT